MMKKALVVLLLAAFLVPAFADDALVLPQGVWRTRIVPVYSFSSQTFEDDFGVERTSSDGVGVFSLGFAIEYGINDWITAAAQWAPGIAVWSDVDVDVEKSAAVGGGIAAGSTTVNNWFDLFAGAKFQLVGPNAPFPSQDIRFAVATGVKIPFASADWEQQAQNLNEDKDFVGANVDANVVGIGARVYFDYVFSSRFFINFYGEFISYPVEGDAPSLATYGAVATHNGIIAASGMDPEAYGVYATDKFGYGFDLTLELEPQFIHVASPGLRITPSLPVTFSFTPEPKLNGKNLSSIEGYTAFVPPAMGGPTWIDGKLFPQAGSSSLLTVAPTVEFFFTGLTVPTALQVAYQYPIAGQNSGATNALIIQVKNYLKFW